jgi:hypothetical protein
MFTRFLVLLRLARELWVEVAELFPERSRQAPWDWPEMHDENGWRSGRLAEPYGHQMGVRPTSNPVTPTRSTPADPARGHRPRRAPSTRPWRTPVAPCGNSPWIRAHLAGSPRWML